MDYTGERSADGWWITLPTDTGSMQLGYDAELRTYYAAAFDHHDYYAGTAIGGDAYEIPTPEALTAALRASGAPRHLWDNPELLQALRAAQATA